MAIPSESTSSSTNRGLPTRHVLVIATICLLLGLFVGYFFLGNHATPNVARTQPSGNTTNSSASNSGGHPKLTMEQMKRMADLQASTLIEKSKSDPKNVGLLVQIAGIYQAAHQFQDAAGFFEKALKIDPRNVSARTEMASCLYYSGDVDGALNQLDQALKYNPKDADSLFNLGMIKYRGKKDPAGAIAAWQKLLKTNPNLERKPIVEQMIAEAKAGADVKN